MDRAMRTLALVAAVLAAIPFLGFVAVWVSIGPSLVSWAYIAAASLVWLGLLTARFRVERLRGWTRIGAVLLTLLAMAQIARTSDSPLKLVRVGEPGFFASVGNRLVPERDALLVGTTVVLQRRGDPNEPAEPILSAIDGAYGTAEASGTLPAAYFATYTGQQSSESFDLLVHDVDGADSAVVFLHGFGGNFAVFCWEIAMAAAKANVATLCPSTGWIGRWWLDDAFAVLRITMEEARERGYQRIYVAGLSNGGRGLSRRATELQSDSAGFIYISGVAEDAQPIAHPALVVHGESDSRIGVDLVKDFATKAGAHYVGIDAGHFVIVEERKLVRAAISDWLTEQQRSR